VGLHYLGPNAGEVTQVNYMRNLKKLRNFGWDLYLGLGFNFRDSRLLSTWELLRKTLIIVWEYILLVRR
jgi:hypothetical protein